MNVDTQDHPMVDTSVPRRTSISDTPGPSHIDPTLSNNRENLHDVSERVQITVPGWPTLAKLMVHNPDLQTFSSFADLNVKSLLYYQAELVHLRKQLHKAEWNEYRQDNRNDSTAKYAENLESLFMMVADPDEKTPDQWTIMCKIRDILDKYSNADVESLRYLVGRGGANGGELTGDGSKVWGDPHVFTMPKKTLSELILNALKGVFVSSSLPPIVCENEFKETLIVASPGRGSDVLTEWIVHSVIPLYDRLWKVYEKLISEGSLPWPRSSRNHIDIEHGSPERNTNSNMRSTSIMADPHMVVRGSWIIRIISIVTTIVACLFPTIAIVILARVQTIGMTLGLIALFTAMFALGLVLVSSGSSRMQIFIATSVFPALMVVFVQNQLTPGGQGVQVQ